MGGQRHVKVALLPGRRPITPCTGGWLGTMAVGISVENLATTRIRSPDCPAHSKLYWLCYSSPQW